MLPSLPSPSPTQLHSIQLVQLDYIGMKEGRERKVGERGREGGKESDSSYDNHLVNYPSHVLFWSSSLPLFGYVLFFPLYPSFCYSNGLSVLSSILNSTTCLHHRPNLLLHFHGCCVCVSDKFRYVSWEICGGRLARSTWKIFGRQQIKSTKITVDKNKPTTTNTKITLNELQK